MAEAMVDFFNKGYPQNRQITYAGMLWLLAAQLIIMAPLSFYLPVWILPILVISAGWRLRVMRGHLNPPNLLVKLVISLIGIGGLVLSGIKPVSLDMMASLLMLGFAYKALEMEQRRDGMVVILTGYILIGVLFLFSQSILTATYGVLSMVVLTAAMIAIQHPKSTTILSSLKLAGVMLLMCLPFMITLFIFAPRFTPLWNFSLSTGKTKTGITDTMSPGDIAELSQSDELAFRVSFKGSRPEQSDLYWRGIVLNYFDGKTWTQTADKTDPEMIRALLKTNKSAIKNRLSNRGNRLDYDIVFESSSQPWVFSLAPVVEVKGNAILGSDYRVMAKTDINEPLLLAFSSYPKARRDVILTPARRQDALQLPKTGNEKSQALARRLIEKSTSHLDYIKHVLKLYHEEEFFYTLHPSKLGNDSIDDFLLGSKRGFCAHYASSFVFMMRSAGIPSRVVSGYQGGEWNEKGDYLAVRQFDAHAWAEVWLKGSGWIRVDPTKMVAPDRIEKNLATAMKKEGSFLESQLMSSIKYPWLDGIRKRLDSGKYAWRKFVLTYDERTRADLMKQFFGGDSLLKIVLVIGTVFGVILLLWFTLLGLFRRPPKEASVHQIYRRFCKVIEKQGLKREDFQAPTEFSQLASKRLPSLASEISEFTNQYTQLCYQPMDESAQKTGLVKLKSLLKKIKAKRGLA